MSHSDENKNKIKFAIARTRPNVLRKTIEGYLESIPSPTVNTIKTESQMHFIVLNICYYINTTFLRG